tara:strand:+ start:486 stop:782 length:297 start_codon:yes stop_codon:yes gene_type:complete
MDQGLAALDHLHRAAIVPTALVTLVSKFPLDRPPNTWYNTPMKENKSNEEKKALDALVKKACDHPMFGFYLRGWLGDEALEEAAISFLDSASFQTKGL